MKINLLCDALGLPQALELRPEDGGEVAMLPTIVRTVFGRDGMATVSRLLFERSEPGVDETGEVQVRHHAIGLELKPGHVGLQQTILLAILEALGEVDGLKRVLMVHPPVNAGRWRGNVDLVLLTERMDEAAVADFALRIGRSVTGEIAVVMDWRTIEISLVFEAPRGPFNNPSHVFRWLDWSADARVTVTIDGDAVKLVEVRMIDSNQDPDRARG